MAIWSKIIYRLAELQSPTKNIMDFKIVAMLKMAREESGLSQEEIAKIIGTYKNNFIRKRFI